jgi:hypothetical protein
MFLMRPSKMAYMTVFSYPRVRYVIVRVLLKDSYLIRRHTTWEYMVRRLCSVPALASTIYRAILHDPNVFPEPEVFKPERFLNPNGTLRDEPTLVSAFGYGRRICPARHFAEATLFIVAASVLSVFHIEKGRGCEDRPFEFTYSGGLIRYIQHFCCPVEIQESRLL